MAKHKRRSLPRRRLSKPRKRRLPCGCIRVLASQATARAARQLEAARRGDDRSQAGFVASINE
jgi:hypothetical protein